MDALKVVQLSPIEMAEQVVKLEALHREIKAKLDELKGKLLTTTKELDVYTLKTGTYTITRATRGTIKVLNKRALAKELEEKGVDVLYSIDMEYMKPVVKNMLPELANATEEQTEYVSVRLTKKETQA